MISSPKNKYNFFKILSPSEQDETYLNLNQYLFYQKQIYIDSYI